MDRVVFFFHLYILFFQNKHSLAATQLLKIKILDVNDIAPRFEKRAITGQVFENERPGTIVTKVQAVDSDVTPEFRKVNFLIFI